ncbi:MAG: M48 family metalloprotease [Flavobacteriaceae bacterium]|nr:M48 family metalloprotease [Flavobacteriaceae bacterium]
MTTTYYPKSPVVADKKLTSLTSTYQLKAFLSILAIILFFILYFALVASLGYLAYYAVIYDMGSINKLTILMKVGAIAGAVMLFVFTLKFIFKLKNHKPSNLIKLDTKEHPELMGFIHNICEETGAPKPKSVYVDPDVNAYVSYSNMWLSLFLPVRKELTIGMGLVDCLNLTEFKAVISHEFGHFAQRSMKIGSYIISANTIIHDMIFARDKWDDLLDQWRGSDLRLSAAAWVITPIIWLIRQVLNLFYQFLNMMYSSLSREMEFNADKVAVNTSGSDAIISALWKLDGGVSHWNSTVNHAYLASQKQQFVKNMYTHNGIALSRGADKQQEAMDKLPEDPRGGKHYFSTSEVSKVSMYASHPPNDKRENNAKEPYIACEEDARSPWILFGSQEALQEKMTQLVYKEYLNKEPENYVESEAFEAFIAAETKGSELLEAYDNTFLNRYMHVPDYLTLEAESDKPEFQQAAFAQQLKTDLQELMQPVKELENLMEKAQQIAAGTTKEKAFSIHGLTYDKKNLQQGYDYLVRQREQLFEDSFKKWDASFCAFHYALAKKAGKQKELSSLYEQHRGIVHLYKSIANAKSRIYQKVGDAQQQGEVTQGVINALMHDIKKAMMALDEELQALDTKTFAPLPNIDNREELKNAIVEGGAFKQPTGNIFENGGFDMVVNSLESAMVNCQRIDQKSIGSLLTFHEGLLEGQTV